MSACVHGADCGCAFAACCPDCPKFDCIEAFAPKPTKRELPQLQGPRCRRCGTQLADWAQHKRWHEEGTGGGP